MVRVSLDPAVPAGPWRVGITLRSGPAHSLLVRIDTPIEAAYYAAGGIMPYVLEQVASASPVKKTHEVRSA